MMGLFGFSALVLFCVLAFLIWADTAQVIYTAKRFGHYQNRHYVLLRSHHYFLAAVAMFTKALLLPLVLVIVAFYTGWLAMWLVDVLLIGALLYRARVIERNQSLMDLLESSFNRRML